MRPVSFLKLAVVLVLGTLGACSSGHGSPPDGASRDGTTYDLSLDLPPGCPPTQANEKGVGAPCTRNGHQCTGGLLCACDTNLDNTGLTLNGVPCVCTIAGLNSNPKSSDPCASAGANVCGTDATCCNYLSTAYYCSPNVCLPGGACINFSPADGG
ncbi:MAG TPA: hypothetical protein VHG72_20495 [Polyangia bacterium]|nr:hypothetical protein [Polyangia bacterium]